MRPPETSFAFAATGVALLLISSCIRMEPPKPVFTLAWSVYVGYDPYPYMQRAGILRRWADKYNVDIQLRRLDYASSIDAFVSKSVDACAMTNIEAVDMPAAAGIDTTNVVNFGDGYRLLISNDG